MSVDITVNTNVRVVDLSVTFDGNTVNLQPTITIGGGGGGVQSVTGNLIDNTDPLNPVANAASAISSDANNAAVLGSDNKVFVPQSSGGQPSIGNQFTGVINFSNREGFFYEPYNIANGIIEFSEAINGVVGGVAVVLIQSDGVNPFTTRSNINEVFKTQNNIPNNLILPKGKTEIFFFKTTNGLTIAASETQVEEFVPESLGDIAFAYFSDSLNQNEDDEILIWTDSSGQTKPAIATTGRAPILKTVDGFKTLRFDGINDFMITENVTNLGGINTECSFYVVSKADEPINGDIKRSLFALDNSISDNSKNLTPIVYLDNLTITISRAKTVQGQIFSSYYKNGFSIWLVNKKGALIDVYKNSELVIEDYNVAGLEFGGSVTLGAIISQLDNFGSNFFKGNVLAFGAYYKQLNSEEINYINNGFSNLYGIALNSYEPLYVDSTNLVYAIEADSVDTNFGFNIPALYPINVGKNTTRNDQILPLVTGVTYNVDNNIKKISFTGNQNKSITNLNIFPTGGIDSPITLFYVGQFTTNDTNQLMFGLAFDSSVNNNLIIAGRSSINEHYVHRRISTNVSKTNLGALNNDRHIVCYNIKSGGLMDLWVDGIKVSSNINMTTGVALAFANKVILGNNQPNTEPSSGSFELGHLYNASLSDSLIEENFVKINNRLNVY